MKRFVCCVGIAVLGAALLTTGTAAADDIVWDGATANWDSSNWNGSQSAVAVFGQDWGMQAGNGIGDDAFINAGTVTFAKDGDFSMRGAVTLSLSGGSTLLIPSANPSSPDGHWSQFDGEALNIDGATFSRGNDATTGASGGPMILGSWRTSTGQKIDVNVTGGGSFLNDGQVWFGCPSDNDPEIEVTMTINNGTVDLTGGNRYTTNGGMTNDDKLYILEDLAFCYGYDTDNFVPKNEKYAVNFAGPGTFRVDNGIIAPIQDPSGGWYMNILYGAPNQVLSYEEIFNADILRARGAPKSSGLSFSRYFAVSGSPDAANYTLTSTVPTAASAPIVWDGGDGNWTDAKWNSGKTSQQVLGRNNGVEFGTTGEQGIDVFINGGTVTYDPNTYGDFRYKRAGTLNLSGGATLQMDTTEAADGKWTQWNGEELNIDGATLRRGFVSGGGAQSGGAFILGTWSSYAGQKMAVNITGGGRIENDGQLWFGCPSDNAIGIEVTMTIDDGSVNLTGGDNYVQDNDGKLLSLQDLVFCYNYDADTMAPRGETYVINFVGPGDFTVDDGIIAPVMDSSLTWSSSLIGGTDPYALLSYEDLWNVGILQANGLSGLDGATFGDYFTVSGQKNMDNYTLTSLLGGPALPGDLNGDGAVNSGDLDLVRGNWGTAGPEGDANGDGAVNSGDLDIVRANWGATAAASAVPEPGTLLLLLAGILALSVRRR